MSFKENPFLSYGIAICAIGLVLLFGSQLYEGFQVHPGESWAVLSHALRGLLEKTALALIVIGVIDLTLHIPSVNKYFADRLSDLIIRDEYLTRLGAARLTELLNRALGALAGSPDLSSNQRGSFLEYFHRNLRSFISSPYRETAVQVIHCDHLDEKYFKVTDTLTYICRAATGKIQERIYWSNLPGEMEDETVAVRVLPPGKNSTDWEEIATDQEFMYVHAGEPKPAKKKLAGKVLLCTELSIALDKKYSACDGLSINISARYKIKKDRMQSWQVSALTRGVSLMIHYPLDHDVQVTTCIIDDGKAHITDLPGYFQLRFEPWVLPGEGFCWKFSSSSTQIPAQTAASSPHGAHNSNPLKQGSTETVALLKKELADSDLDLVPVKEKRQEEFLKEHITKFVR